MLIFHVYFGGWTGVALYGLWLQKSTGLLSCLVSFIGFTRSCFSVQFVCVCCAFYSFLFCSSVCVCVCCECSARHVQSFLRFCVHTSCKSGLLLHFRFKLAFWSSVKEILGSNYYFSSSSSCILLHPIAVSCYSENTILPLLYNCCQNLWWGIVWHVFIYFCLSWVVTCVSHDGTWARLAAARLAV